MPSRYGIYKDKVNSWCHNSRNQNDSNNGRKHIDRTSNGAVAILGTFPDWEGYTAYEVSNSGSRSEEEEKFPVLKGMPCVKSSDAHYLWDISEAENYFELSDEPYSSQLVRDKLIDLLEGK